MKLKDIKANLKRNFEMTDVGEPKSFLGLEIQRDRKSLTLKIYQENYIIKMLIKFGYQDVHPQRTPMITNQVANRQRKEREEKEDISELITTENNNNIPYCEVIGTLLYLANACRPDIVYAVNVLSRHQIKPTDSDWQGVERVFRYLKGTATMGLNYHGKSDCFEGYSDASFGDFKNSLSRDGTFLRAEPQWDVLTCRAEMGCSYAPSRDRTFLRAERR